MDEAEDAVAPAEVPAAFLLRNVFGHEAAPGWARLGAGDHEQNEQTDEDRDAVRPLDPGDQPDKKQQHRRNRTASHEELEPAADAVNCLDGEKLGKRAEKLRKT